MTLSSVWILFCGSLLFFMQAGFTCYEAGFVQSKNVISVTIENLMTFCITVLAFALVGFPLMFGHGQHFWLLKMGSLADAGYLMLFVQTMFAAVSVTIFAGAMSERTRLLPLLAASLISATIIYPVFGQWVWGNSLEAGGAWLHQMGFVDYAGASVVHITAGGIALAGLIVTGARETQHVGKSNIPLATLGVFILCFGWFGFNGVGDADFQHMGLIFINTVLSSATGMAGAIAMNFATAKRGGYMISIFNGVLVGLVSVTAISKFCDPVGAAIVGFIAGVFSELVQRLEKKYLDDVVNVIPTHLCGGIVGCLSVPFVCKSAYLAYPLWQQLGIQLLGVAVNLLWSFGMAYVMFRVIHRIRPIRVSQAEERKGLNIVEFHDIYSWEKYEEISAYESQIEEKNRLLRKQARLLVATEFQEKNALARELHDGVGQSLAALKLLMNLNLRYAEQTGDEKLCASARQALKLADSSLSEIRTVLGDLRPQYLEQGLEQGLRYMTENLSSLEGFSCTLEVAQPIPAFDETVSLNIYRLIQEALTNVVKHAHSATAEVICRSSGNGYSFEVIDHGIGFDRASITLGVGLQSMQDRISMLGGQMRVESSDRGTHITWEVPI